jgi:hypothetical protein
MIQSYNLQNLANYPKWRGCWFINPTDQKLFFQHIADKYLQDVANNYNYVSDPKIIENIISVKQYLKTQGESHNE